MNALKLGARVAALPLRSVDGALPLWLGALLCCACAYLERSFAPHGAVDRALTRDCFGLILPLTAYALFERASGAGRLDHIVRPIARYGASGRRALLGAILLLLAVNALAGTVFAGVTVVTARGLRDPSLFSDLLISAWVGALAGLAYSSWLALASGIGQRGSGRKWLVLLDLVVGGSGTTAALLWPRPHVQNLLGAEPVLGQTQLSAALLLLLASALTVLVALGRAPS